MIGLLLNLAGVHIPRAAEPDSPVEKVHLHLEGMLFGDSQAELQSLKAMGTNAVPLLIEVLGYSKLQIDNWYQQVRPRHPEANQTESAQTIAKSRLVNEAMVALVAMPETPFFVTNLFPLLKDSRWEVRRSAAGLLEYFAPKVGGAILLPALPALKDADAAVRRSMIGVFGHSAVQSEVRKALEESLNDSREELRIQAAKKLLGSDKNHAVALSTLKSLFASKNFHTRYFAVREYIDSDPIRPRTEKELLPVLMRLLASGDAWSQSAAANSLSKYGPSGRDAVPELQKLLLAGDVEVRQSATNALREIAPEVLPGQPAAPANRDVVLQLLQTFYSTNQAVVFQSIKAMGTNAVPILIEVLGYQTTQMDQWYERAYAKAPTSIQSRMSKPETLEKLRNQASSLLRNMPETHLFLTNLLVLLKDERVAVRQSAAYLIPSCIRNHGQHLDDNLMLECLPALKDNDPLVRRYMLGAFVARWAVLPRAKTALETVLKDPVEEVRLEAGTVLLRTDGNNQAALQTLKSLFASTNASNRYLAAARYLFSSSPSGRLEDEMVPIFTATLSGTDRDLQIGACHCLGRFGPRAKTAVPVLLKHLQSTDLELQKAAREALEKIAPELLPPVKP